MSSNKQKLKKLAQIINDRIFTNFRTGRFIKFFFTCSNFVSVAMIVWLDRRVWGLVQKRKGPNVVGPFGLFQTLADALKYIFKEIIIPASANKVVFILAPIVTMTLALVAWAVIPMSENLVLVRY